MINRYAAIVAIFLFLLFIGTGPIPIKILGMKVDYLISMFFLLSIVNLANYRIKINKFLYILVFYCSLILPSVIFSENFIFSLENYFYTLAYAFIAYISTMSNISLENYSKLYKISIISIVLSCSLILFLYSFSDYVGQMRFRIVTNINKSAEDINLLTESVDPNITAIGLTFLFLFIMPGIIKLKIALKKLVLTSLISLLIFSLLILQSKTAFAMIFLAILMFFIVKSNIKINYTYVLLLMATLLPIIVFQSSEFFSIIDRFSNSIESESQPTGRIDLITSQFHILLSSYKNILIGNGFMISNPHNEYLKNLFNSGMLGFLGFISLIAFLIFTVTRNSKINHGNTLFAWLMLIPYLFSLGVYGHTKSLWVGAALCLIVSKVKFNDKSNLVLNGSALLKCSKK